MDQLTISINNPIVLPWPINYLPSIFKFLALINIAPVILLILFDIGGYLLFKLFYKPFGDYPMYSYFKQAPPRDSYKTKHSTQNRYSKPPSSSSSSNLTDNSISLSNHSNPQITLIDNDSSKHSSKKKHQTHQISKNHLQLDSFNHSARNHSEDSQFEIRHGHVGFDGPMLDCKSPHSSDWEDFHSNRDTSDQANDEAESTTSETTTTSN